MGALLYRLEARMSGQRRSGEVRCRIGGNLAP